MHDATEVLLLLIFFVALLLVLVHTARSIWRVAFADSLEAGPPSVEIEDGCSLSVESFSPQHWKGFGPCSGRSCQVL